jgi:hypothetical protein
MAHFARIEKGIVREVIVVNNSDCGGGDFPESEPIGQKFINFIGLEGEWKQTSYNSNFRGAYAGLAYTYDSDLDEFYLPIPIEIEAPTIPTIEGTENESN